jgi:secreted trypsin-like serine protease
MKDAFIVSTRIVGGKAADIGQYPWLVNLGYVQVNVSFT